MIYWIRKHLFFETSNSCFTFFCFIFSRNSSIKTPELYLINLSVCLSVLPSSSECNGYPLVLLSRTDAKLIMCTVSCNQIWEPEYQFTGSINCYSKGILGLDWSGLVPSLVVISHFSYCCGCPRRHNNKMTVRFIAGNRLLTNET